MNEAELASALAILTSFQYDLMAACAKQGDKYLSSKQVSRAWSITRRPAAARRPRRARAVPAIACAALHAPHCMRAIACVAAGRARSP